MSFLLNIDLADLSPGKDSLFLAFSISQKGFWRMVGTASVIELGKVCPSSATIDRSQVKGAPYLLPRFTSTIVDVSSTRGGDAFCPRVPKSSSAL